MAEKIVNNGVVFAYSSNDAFFELKTEFEKYFLYQTILFVDLNFECGSLIERLQQNTSCNILVTHKLDKNCFENVDFVVIVNDKCADFVKQFCDKNHMPYMVLLTKVLPYSVCSDKVFDARNKQKVVAKPFGIVLDKSQIFAKKDFVFGAVIEILATNFDIGQKKFCNWFFGENISFLELKEDEKLIINLEKILSGKNYDINQLFDKICDAYVMCLIKRAGDDIDLIDRISQLYLRCNKKQKYCAYKIKYLYMQILTYIQFDYIKKYKSGFSQTIDYKTHQSKLLKYGQSGSFVTKVIPENKTNFLFEQFKNKLVEFATEQLEFAEKTKEYLAEIDIDKLYGLSMYIDREIFADMISLEPVVFEKSSFLKLMFAEGLLNFGI